MPTNRLEFNLRHQSHLLVDGISSKLGHLYVLMYFTLVQFAGSVILLGELKCLSCQHFDVN